MHNRSGCPALVAIGVCLLLAACGGHDSVPSFAPADYSYLPKLRLMVGSVTIEDHASQAASPDDLAPTAPVPPDQALQQMARDRLIAVGNSGTGVFTIDQASISGSGGGALDGRLAVHLDILTGNGGHTGYAEAHVSRQFIPGANSVDAGTRAQLYELTQQMMQDMNVELEYQVRRSLRDWLVDASGTPVAAGVDQQTLPPPDGSMPVTSTPSGGMPSGSVPSGGVQVGTTPVGATPLASAPGSNPPVPAPSGATTGPVPLAPQPDAPGALPNNGGPIPLTPDATTTPRSPPPGFLQSPGGAPVPPPAADSY